MRTVSTSQDVLPVFQTASFETISQPDPHVLRRVADEGSALVLGDVLRVLRMMPDGCAQTVVTSPPYWGLRDYHVDGQIGLESSVYEYIIALGLVFDEVRRVLKDDGTLWLNIGDSYTSGGRKWRAPDKKNKARGMSVRPDTPDGLKPKELIGVPWRLAMELQSRGWYLRSDIIWEKPNCQPESVRDRPTQCHEHVFLMSRSERYKYNIDAMKGPNGRRVRDVWSINTKTYKAASGHFAIFPIDLVVPCIRFGSDEGDLVLDPFMGSGSTALAASSLRRRFMGVELNPVFYDMARGRLVDGGLSVRHEGVADE